MRSPRGRQFTRLDDSSRDAAVVSEATTSAMAPIDTSSNLLPEGTEGMHVLLRSRFMLSAFACAQTVFALSAVAVLSDASVRTGWAHTFGLFCVVLCAVEGAVHGLLRSLGKLNARYDIVSLISCSLCFASMIGLVTNTEDDAHGVPIDDIETAVSLFILAWGLMAARLSAAFVEREATRECTFEVRFCS